MAAGVPEAGFTQVTKATTYTNPFAYCAAVGTVDQPGPRYRGAEHPKDIVTSMSKATGGSSLYPGQTTWRCEGGRVMGCYLGASGENCSFRVDRAMGASREMIRYCRTRSSGRIPEAAAGPAWFWRCNGGAPQLDPTVVAPSGYLTSAWVVIAAPAANGATSRPTLSGARAAVEAAKASAGRARAPASTAQAGGMSVIESCFTEFHRRAARRLYDQAEVKSLYTSQVRTLAIQAKQIICRHAKNGHYDGTQGFTFANRFNQTKLSGKLDYVSQDESLDYYSLIAAFVTVAETSR